MISTTVDQKQEKIGRGEEIRKIHQGMEKWTKEKRKQGKNYKKGKRGKKEKATGMKNGKQNVEVIPPTEGVTLFVRP